MVRQSIFTTEVPRGPSHKNKGAKPADEYKSEGEA